MDPVGIEPTPLVLQTSVRTSYTKGPILTTTIFTAKWLVVVQGVTRPSSNFNFLIFSYPETYDRDITLFVGNCGIEPHLLTERFYRPLTSPDAETSQMALSN